MGFWSNVGDFFTGAWEDITGVTATKEAGEAQTGATEAAIQFSKDLEAAKMKRLSPYMQAGETALNQQQALSGLLGPEAQQQAIAGIQSSPGFQESLKAGETSILQTASATGGLRGGRTQDVLSQYAPQMLGQAIDRQMGQLGGLTSLGQASAAGGGQSAVPGLMSQLGGQQASSILGQYGAQSNFLSDAAGFGLQLGGLFAGGGFGGGNSGGGYGWGF